MKIGFGTAVTLNSLIHCFEGDCICVVISKDEKRGHQRVKEHLVPSSCRSCIVGGVCGSKKNILSSFYFLQHCAYLFLLTLLTILGWVIADRQDSSLSAVTWTLLWKGWPKMGKY